MGSAKRAQRRAGKPHSQMRARTTRSKGKVSLSDPAESTQLLTEQLRSLGLYAAPTLGDGNCLFRALSDQLYGSPSRHAQLRQDICDWIQSYKVRYEPFVDDERGLDVHLQCMRQNATYGGHLELSAFAHMTKRNVKVIQPGLVYVIEWAAGWDPSNDDDDERRRLRRDKKRGKAPQDDIDIDDESIASTIYVAYHDWEHFSSIRNLKGPHAGLPSIQELPADDVPLAPSKPMPPIPPKRLPKVKLKVAKPINATIGIQPPTPLETPAIPEQIPLPLSRSCSPLSPSVSPSPPPQPYPYPSPAALSPDSLRVHRSPKRSFDESSAGSGSGSESVAKRTRSQLSAVSHSLADTEVDDDQMNEDDADVDTPDLSAPGSSSSSSQPDSDASSAASSPLPTHEPEPTPRPLTRRQRKALGLPPKPRAPLVIAPRPRTGAGTIVIPGGRYKANGPTVKKAVRVKTEDGDAAEDEDDEDENAEWRRNGNGRVDVRGFRELKI